MKGPLAFLAVAAMLALAIVAPQYITVKYYVQLILLALIWTIMAHGQNIIQGMTGYVSITQAGLMGVGAYASTLLSIRLGWPVWASMAVAPFITALFSILVGYPSLRVKGHYFAIVTLAFNMVIFTVLLNFTTLTRGEAGIPNIKRPESLFGLVDFDDRVAYYYLVLAVAVVMTLLTWLLMRSSIGRILRAIRQNENLASACGVAVWRYKLFAFVASAFYAGAAGALYAHYIGFINPETFGVAQSLDAILAVILGGTGTLFGPVLGAFAVVFLPEYLRIADSFRLIVYGLLLVVATIFMPRGALHVFERAWDFAVRRLGGTK
ncbi:MAG: branched-chain amino acid ABC transporter permease [Magnetospirillum sp.]|nr:branched-chain amino acid ABC transporter permease [Magnetospirillum sp.]